MSFTLTGTNLDAPDATMLADFYRRLLGWTMEVDEPGWVVLRPPGGGHTLNFQTEPRYVRPVWPAGSGDPQMMMHLEIRVGDLTAAAAQAVGLGATLAEFQPQEDVRVCLDPAGHPFCLYVEPRPPVQNTSLYAHWQAPENPQTRRRTADIERFGLRPQGPAGRAAPQYVALRARARIQVLPAR